MPEFLTISRGARLRAGNNLGKLQSSCSSRAAARGFAMGSHETSVVEIRLEGKTPSAVLVSDLALELPLRKAALGSTGIHSLPAVEPKVEVDIPAILPGGGKFRA